MQTAKYYLLLAIVTLMSLTVRADESAYPSLDELKGLWEWKSYDMYSDKFASFDVGIYVMQEGDYNEDGKYNIEINDVLWRGSSFMAFYDQTAGTITIPSGEINAFTGTRAYQRCVMAAFRYTLEDGELTSLYPDADLPLVLTYDPEQGGFVNPDIIYGVVWADEDGVLATDMDNWIELYNQAYMTPANTEPADFVEEPGDFEHVGYAELYDGWISPEYDPDYMNMPVVVPVERSKSTEGVYRLVGPFTDEVGHPWSGYGGCPGYIMLNIAEPRLPYLYANVHSGWRYGPTLYGYHYDFNGYQVCVNGLRADPYYFEVAFDSKKVSTYDAETFTLTVPVSMYGYRTKQGKKVDGLVAETAAPSKIRLLFDPSALTATQTDADGVTFYNLQGQPVANPGSGIYIMRQGSESRKVMLRR